MDRVAGESPLQQKAAFLQRPGGLAVVDIAGRFNAKHPWQMKRQDCERPNGFDHQALAPVLACEHIPNIDNVGAWTSFEHADKLAARLEGDDVRVSRAGVPLSNAASDETARGLQRGMRLPDHVPRDVRILGV